MRQKWTKDGFYIWASRDMFRVFDSADIESESEPGWLDHVPSVRSDEFDEFVDLAGSVGFASRHLPRLDTLGYSKCVWLTKDDARELGIAVLLNLELNPDTPGAEFHAGLAEWMTRCNGAVIAKAVSA